MIQLEFQIEKYITPNVWQIILNKSQKCNIYFYDDKFKNCVNPIKGYMTNPLSSVPYLDSSYIVKTLTIQSCKKLAIQALNHVLRIRFLMMKPVIHTLIPYLKLYASFKKQKYNVSNDNDYLTILSSGNENLINSLVSILSFKDGLNLFSYVYSELQKFLQKIDSLNSINQSLTLINEIYKF